MSGTSLPNQDEQTNRRSRASKGKSRSGCVACKERRVKCGEQHPKCARCTTQNRECVYEFVEEPKWKQKTSVFSVAGQPSLSGDNCLAASDRITPPIDRARTPNFNFQSHFEFVGESVGKQSLSVPAIEPPSFDPQDAMLLEHFLTSTSTDLILPQACWTQDLINTAFEHKFFMHAILAVSACHLRKLHESCAVPPIIDYHTLEGHHLHLALSNIRVMFSEIDIVANQDAFLGASFLFAIYYGSSRDFDPFTSEPERGVCVHIKAVTSIAQKNCEQARRGPFKHICTPPLYHANTTPTSGPLVNLMDRLNNLVPRPTNYALYVERIESLTTLFATTTGREFTQGEAEHNLLWLLRYAGFWRSEVMLLASQQDPITSIIIAHWYAAGLYNIGYVGDRWWFWREKPVLMISGVSASIGDEWDAWLEWPMAILANSPW